MMKNDFLDRFIESKKYISREYQDFGLRISGQLNDPSHKALYIRLAKDIPRHYVELALQFSLDYPKVENKGKIFMWKLKQICDENNYKMKFYPRKKKKKKTSQYSIFK